MNEERLIKFRDGIEINSIDDLLMHAIYNGKRTYYSDNGHLQCDPGKRRSIEDLMLLQKYYKLNLTLKELLKSIDRFKKGSIIIKIHPCENIQKNVCSTTYEYGISHRVNDTCVSYNNYVTISPNNITKKLDNTDLTLEDIVKLIEEE